MPSTPRDSVGGASADMDLAAHTSANEAALSSLELTTSKVISTQARYVASLAASAGKSKEGTAAYLREAETLQKLKQATDGVTEALGGQTEAQKKGNKESLLNLALVTQMVDKADGYARALSNNVRAQIEYRLEIEQITRSLQNAQRGYAETRDTLRKMRTDLHLTREEFKSFSKTVQEGVEVGIDTSELTEMTKNLQRTRGHAGGQAALGQTVTAYGGGAAGAQAAFGAGGSQEERARVLATVSREEGRALQDERRGRMGGGSADAEFSEDLAEMDAGFDSVKEAINEQFGTVTKLLGPWGPAIVGAPVVLAVVAQTLSQGAMLWGVIAKAVTTHTGLLAQVAINTGMKGPGGGGGPVPGGGGSRMHMKGMKIGGAGLMGSMALGAASHAVRSNKEWISEQTGVDEETVDKTGRTGSALSKVAGGAASGAMLGSFVGPIGTAVGAVAGGLIGIASDWKNIKELTGEFFGYVDKAATDSERSEQALDAVTGRLKKIGGRIKGIQDRSKEGLAQDVGKLAEQKQVSAVQHGGGFDLGKLQAQQFEGAAAERKVAMAGFDAELATERAELEAIPKHWTAVRQQHQRTITKLQAAKQEAKNSFDEVTSIAKITQNFAERFAKLTVNLKAAQESADASKDLFQNISGPGRYGDRANLAEENLKAVRKSEAEEQENLKKGARDRILAIRSETGGGAEGRNERNSKVEQEQRNLEAGISGSEARVTMAMSQSVHAIFDEAQAVIDQRTQDFEARMLNVNSQRADMALGASRARGMTPGQRGGAADLVSRTAEAEAQRLVATESQDLAAINATLAKRVSETNDVDLKKLYIAEESQKITDRVNLTQEALNKSYEAGTQSAMERGEAEAALLGVQEAQLAAQKDVAETIGSSFGTLHSIAMDMVQLKQQELQITNEQIAKMRALNKDINSPAMQELMKKQAQQQAEIFKSAMGVQRDFLDRALSRAFGAPTGTKFSPAMTERALFGEHTVGKDGMKIKGQMTREEKAEALQKKGSQFRNVGNRPAFEAGLNPEGGGFGEFNNRNQGGPAAGFGNDPSQRRGGSEIPGMLPLVDSNQKVNMSLNSSVAATDRLNATNMETNDLLKDNKAKEDAAAGGVAKGDKGQTLNQRSNGGMNGGQVNFGSDAQTLKVIVEVINGELVPLIKETIIKLKQRGNP